MRRPACRSLVARGLSSRLLLALLVLIGVARADDPTPAETPTFSLTDSAIESARIDQLEQTLQSVVEQNRWLADEVRELRQQTSGRSFEPEMSADCAAPASVPGLRSDAQQVFRPRYTVSYDNGFVLLPENFDESPFSLKINNQATFRYSGFAAGQSSWTDSAGNVNSIDSTSNFLIPRGRLIFSGKAFAPEISYLVNIDYNSVSNNPIGFRAYVLSYQFSRALEVSVGQNKVPGTREWLLSSWVSQEGPDRSMATTFFRPSLSQGIWIKGEPVDRLFYHVMLSNGFNTLNVAPSEFNQRLCFSESVWWEPLGDFGPGYSDLEAHENPAVRVGSSYTFALGKGSQSGSSSPENSSLRLSDGTVITQTGALAPGVTLQSYDVSLAAIDLAFKNRGFSLSTELYSQQLLSLKGNGALPVNSTQAYGGFLQGGYFVIPQKCEVYSRTSYVTGAYGSGNEFAGGFNWFPILGKSNLRYTFDTAWIDHSPADQNRTGYFAGQTGLLIRTQINTSF